jgi:predicted ABC-type ATPase
MNEEQAKQWVKNKTNQSMVVDSFFLKNKPRKVKSAFFMAGVPGAGKTEFAEGVIKASPGLVPIEHDQLVEYIDGYAPEAYYNYRKAGSVLVTRIFDECLRNGYPFVFDGTLSHENGAKNITKALKAGYAVIVVYIVQDAGKAWELTKARELVKKRSIERTGFMETCRKINQNLLNVFKEHKNNHQFGFWLIDKQGQHNLRNATAIMHGTTLDNSKEIEKALQKTYNI